MFVIGAHKTLAKCFVFEGIYGRMLVLLGFHRWIDAGITICF